MPTNMTNRSNQISDNLEDELLIEKIHNGEPEHLEYIIKKYKNFVRSKAGKYFLIGGEKEDLFQEGMIGLYKAIRDYRVEKMVSFISFVDLCVNRQIISAVKGSTRKKHIPLNFYTSLDRPVYEDENSTRLLDILPGISSADPAGLLIGKEEKEEFEEKLKRLLSELERNVLTLYLEGLSYVEMSEELDIHIKTIDNALMRVKRKIEKYFILERSK